MAPLRAWPVASSIAREKSTSKNQAKGRRSWLLTQAFEPRSRRTERRATLLDRDRRTTISVGCSKSCINFTSCDLLLQLRNWHVGLHFLGGRFCSRPANQLFLIYGDASGSISQLPSGQEAFCRGRLLHVDDEEATLLSAWRVALGDNELSNYTLRILTPETWRSRRRPAPCHRRKRASGARAEEARDSGLELVTRTWLTVQHTRAAWATLATTFFWQQGYRYQSYCYLLLKSRGWHTGFACKQISAKKKTDRPPVKIWAMLVEAETFFCLALLIFFYFLIYMKIVLDCSCIVSFSYACVFLFPFLSVKGDGWCPTSSRVPGRGMGISLFGIFLVHFCLVDFGRVREVCCSWPTVWCLKDFFFFCSFLFTFVFILSAPLPLLCFSFSELGVGACWLC